MYKRLNLEDVTYFKDDATAAKVRTIVNKGFWPDDTSKTLAALRTATGRSNLTAAEALSGTQLAVWEYGNSGSVAVSNYYSISQATTSPGTYQTQSGVGNNANEHGDLKNNRSATTAANIAAVRDYLLDYAQTHPTTRSAADVIFNDAHFVNGYKVNASDGSVKNGYEVTVAFTLAGTSTSGDLTLTASQGGKTVYTSKLDKVSFDNNEYKITFKTNDIKSDVVFSLNGTQNIPDSVYFYQAEQVSASQSFVGRGSGSTFVDATAKISMKDITVDDHDYDDGVITKEPTCTEKGEKTYTCKNDPTHTRTEEVAPKGHTPVTDEKVEPTCTDKGLTEGSHCKDCGEILEKQEEIPATEHDFDDGVITKEPTCTEKGEKTYTCKNDPAHTYTEVIDEKEHEIVIDEVVAPTYTETGLTQGSHCKQCGKVFEKQMVIAKLTHDESTSPIKEQNKTENKNDNTSSSNNSNKTSKKDSSTVKSDKNTKSPSTGNNVSEIMAYSILAMGFGCVLVFTVSTKKKRHS